MRKIISPLLGASALWVMTAVAVAAEPSPLANEEAIPAGSEETGEATAGEEEVVVTAQRREERLQDVPISVSVVREDQAKSAGVVNTRELPLVVPGLVGGQAGYTFQPSVRGISSTGTGAGDESNVALYVDGVYMSSMGSTAFNLANIDRIEVSKGPQGTLFGRNATGGAIRVVTKKPSFEPEAKLMASVGFNGAESREVSLYTSTGLSDTVAVGLSFYGYDDSGYLTNADPNYDGPDQGMLNSYLGRLQLLYQPNDNLRILVSGDYGQSRSNVELTTTFIDNINGFKNVVGVIPPIGTRIVSTNEANYQDGLFYGGSINVEYQAGDYTITSLTALRTTHIRVSLDNDRTNIALNRNVYGVFTDQFSQELTVASDYDGPFNFIAGVYYFNSEATHPYYYTWAATIGPVVGGVRQVTQPISVRSHITGQLDTESWAVFGEGTYKINDQFSVVGGLRYSADYKDASNRNQLAPTSPEQTSSGDWSNLDYRLTLNYKPDDDTLIYLTNSTGFKAGYIAIGGYSYPQPQQQVKPEKVVAYELGYKSRWFDRLNVSASVFHYDYDDIQVTVNNALSAAAGVVGANVLQNAGKASITGGELEISGRLDDNWSARFGLSLLPTAEYTEFSGGIHYVPAPGGLGAIAVADDISGSRILRSPEATVNFGLVYQTPLNGGDAGSLEISANYFHTKSFYMVIGEASEQPAYSLFSGEIAWTDPSDRFTVSIWGRNLGDEAYYISGLANTGGFSAVWGKPREIGIRLRAAF